MGSCGGGKEESAARGDGIAIRTSTGCPPKGRDKAAPPDRTNGGTHASATQLVALHHGGPGAQLGCPARAGQPARAAPDHQVVIGGHGTSGGRRALRLRLLPAGHGTGEGACDGRGLKQRQLEAWGRARRPPPARPRAGAQGSGIKDFLLLCGRIFLLLALLTLIISVTTSWLNSFKSSQVYLKEEEEKNEKRQKLVRKKQQEAQGEKASRYIENVLKPHREMKLRKLEERFYQMTGEAWKLSSGHKLGGDEGTSQSSFETSNREAAKSQNLPKPLTEFPSPAVQPTCKEIPDLPEEPSQTAEEVVTVALRCPSGNVLRRRFLKSCSSQVLLDWMMRIGYHTSLYSLSTSFPRRPLAVEGGQSLEDVGITVDTVLILEEKEQTN
uniref:UBX domain-containing protein 8 n=1 Tax=Macaca mulatta TaxID=9544 RepID=A0A1D5R8B7_MACMU